MIEDINEIEEFKKRHKNIIIDDRWTEVNTEIMMKGVILGCKSLEGYVERVAALGPDLFYQLNPVYTPFAYSKQEPDGHWRLLIITPTSRINERVAMELLKKWGYDLSAEEIHRRINDTKSTITPPPSV